MAAARALPILFAHWPLTIGGLLLIVPSMARLVTSNWSRESGIHGPILLTTGLWLLARTMPDTGQKLTVRRKTFGALALFPTLIVYIFGRAFGFLSLEIAALFGVIMSIAALICGTQALRERWFPLLYLSFLIPLPGAIVDTVTNPLKIDLSTAATGLLRSMGYPIAHDGVTISIAQYQLLVEDACSGLNALGSLAALSLLYIYLMHRSSWRYAAILLIFVLPAALIANLVRIIALILLTYYAGDATAQSALHAAAGIMTFMVALASIYGVDVVLQRLGVGL